MRLSIIIPAYNAGKYIRECLDSVIGQDLPKEEYEIIVINDGSSDETGAIVEQIAAGQGNIRLFDQENQGPSVARNYGMKLAKGEYLMFVDSDDTIERNCIRRLTDRCISDDLDMLQFSAVNVIGNEHVRRMTYADTDKVVSGKSVLMKKIQVSIPFALYKRSFMIGNDLKLYPGVYSEDDEFKTRALYAAERVSSTNEIIYFVRQSPGSITRTVNPKKSYDCLTVIESLGRFVQTTPDDRYRKGIYLQMSHTFNWCLKEMTGLPGPEVKKLEKLIYSKREMLGYLCKSPSLLHRVEGRIMRIFPRSILKVYKTLNFLHFSKKHR